MPGSDGTLSSAIAHGRTRSVTAAASCLCCGTDSVQALLDFGLQPPSNRFGRPDVPDEETHPLVVGQCSECGLVQLVEPMPSSMVKSHFAWLSYNEPEGHLDELVARLHRLPGLGPDSRIVGLTYKDDSTLARFNRSGYGNTFRYDLATDLKLRDPCAGLESVQAILSDSLASRLAARHGMADVLVARHVLEHAHRPAAFLRAAAKLVKTGGYLVFEMPDCTKFLRACDYSFIWEEHIAYFSSRTLAAFVQSAGLAMPETQLYSYSLEDSLVGVLQNQGGTEIRRVEQEDLEASLADARNFADRFSGTRERLHAAFRSWREQGKRIAIFGAGHLAAKFVNLFSLREFFDCVIDDNPHKQALLMPGSHLPIYASPTLVSRAIDLCLLSLNPESEQKVLAKNQAFVERGGEFLSIFALSPRTIYKACAP
jgi:C-methyltransferase-like protein/methyltransferase family protein/putative zinc binding protein